jgi:hypothetical protein
MNALRALRSSVRQALAPALVIAVAACAHAPRETPAIVPGLAVRFVATARPDTIVYRRSVTQAGHDSSAGTRRVVLRIVTGPGGTRLLEVEQRFPGGGGEIVDTAVAELHTLRAVAHRSHQPTRTMRFTFVGNEAQGTVASARAPGDTAAAVESVRQELGGPIFDSNVIDIVVGALPLDRRFTAELPFFIYERGGKVSMPVAVRERTTVVFPLGRRDVWVVTVGVPGAPATVWVDTRTRAVLRIRYDLSARGISFTDERVTPLPA